MRLPSCTVIPDKNPIYLFRYLRQEPQNLLPQLDNKYNLEKDIFPSEATISYGRCQ